MGPSPTPTDNTVGGWNTRLDADGNGFVTNIAYDNDPEDDFNLLMFACFERRIVAALSWDLPFAGGQYNERYRLNLGHTQEGGVVEERVERWGEIGFFEDDGGGQSLTTYFQNGPATLQELQRWGIVGVQVFDLQGNHVGAAVFRLGGLREAVAQVGWGC